MSWIQWRGETWPVTDGNADLRLYLGASDVGCPRQSWCIDLMQCAETFDPITREQTSERWLNIEVGHLPFTERDWRRWSGVEIRADAAWHDRHEHFNEYGHHEMAFVETHSCQRIIPGQKQNLEGHVPLGEVVHTIGIVLTEMRYRGTGQIQQKLFSRASGKK